jgi:glycopeptide antibiotics resistance protein
MQPIVFFSFFVTGALRYRCTNVANTIPMTIIINFTYVTVIKMQRR